MAKFFRRGKTRVYWLTAVANPAAPTAAEIAAGTNITANVNDLAGFSYSTTQIPTPALDNPFTPSIGGPQTTDDSSLTIYLDSASNPLRTSMANGSVGFVVICDYKVSGSIIAGDKVDVYPSTVIGAPKQRSMGDDPALWIAQFALTAVPNEDVAVV